MTSANFNSHDRTVLHVDDDEQFQKIVEHHLTKAGFNVCSLTNPEQAQKILLDTNCRVCILDIDMPRVSGLELLNDIKSYDGGIQAIMMTGLVSQMTVLESLRGGAEACFFKPLTDPQPLVEALEAAFVKVERWWKSLHQLKDLRHKELQSAKSHAT